MIQILYIIKGRGMYKLLYCNLYYILAFNVIINAPKSTMKSDNGMDKKKIL